MGARLGLGLRSGLGRMRQKLRNLRNAGRKSDRDTSPNRQLTWGATEGDRGSSAREPDGLFHLDVMEVFVQITYIIDESEKTEAF